MRDYPTLHKRHRDYPTLHKRHETIQPYIKDIRLSNLT